MIHGMMCRENKTSIFSIVLLAGFLSEPMPLLSRDNNGFSLAHQSTFKLDVQVYSLPGLRSQTLETAEAEAARLLHPIPVELRWINCGSARQTTDCLSPERPTALTVRILPKALPRVSTAALGITDSSDRYAAAFVFYDRLLALRTHSRLLPTMLGRVIAHELGHLLMPGQAHSEVGLMRGQWGPDDLRIASGSSLGLPATAVLSMQKEVRRRAAGAPGDFR
jgi:hypothetical protein